MKRILHFCLTIAVLISLCACGTAKKEIEKNDDGFLTNLKTGLEQRWDKTSQLADTYTSNSAEKTDKLALINTEKEAIGNLSEYTFADVSLKELAEQYVAALDSQIEGLKYLGSDDKQFRRLYTEAGYFARADIISQLVFEHGFQVDSKYTDTLNDLLDDAEVYTREKTMMNALEEMTLAGVTLKATDMYTASLSLTNPLGMDISDISMNLLSLDKEGGRLDTWTEYFEKWSTGETRVISPYISEEADHYQLYFSYFSSATGIEWNTTPAEVIYQPFDPGVEFVLRTELPADFTPSSWYSRATCHVTDFWTELSYMDGGKSAFILHIAGSKTYDVKGNDYSRSCSVSYRVTNEDSSTVYDTGTFYTDELKVGQSFTDCNTYVDGLTPGTYYVEFYSGKY